IVPGHQWPLEPGQKKPQVIAQSLEFHGPVGHRGVDTKGTSVRTTHASEHGHHLEERRFSERRLNKLPALADTGKRSWLLGSVEVYARGAVLRAIPQDVTERALIREARHIIEI